MYAVFYFVEKFHSYLAGREFTLRVDNQALSWLKTYSMIGRWIARLDQYHFKTIHRPRSQHRNVDGLSKRTNDYINREQILEKLPEVSEGFNFMSQKDYDELPTVPYIDERGHLIPDHPELPQKLELDYLCYTSFRRSERTISLKNQQEISPGIPKFNGKPHRLWKRMSDPIES